MVVTINNDVLEDYLDALVESGFYGFTPQDAVRRLVADQVRQLIKDSPFLFKSIASAK